MGFFSRIFGLSESTQNDTQNEPAPKWGQEIPVDNFSESRIPIRGHSIMRLAEQSQGLQFPNVDAGTEFDDRFFLNLDKTAPLDLPANLQHLAQRLSLISYRKNVRAFRAVETITSFAWGDGPRFRARDESVQQLLEDHWMINQWSKKGPERIRSLSIFGEQAYPVFTNEQTGVVRISSVSPLKIKKVGRDPDDAEELVVVVTTIGGDPHGAKTGVAREGKSFGIIRLSSEGLLSAEGGKDGMLFFFAINRISGASRGLPDILSSIDWLEGMDQFVFSLMERANLASNVVWDITYEGLQTSEVRAKAEEFVRAIRTSGGAYTHNEKVKLDVKAPKLGSSDAETVVRILLRQIQSGTGLAGLFYGDSDDLTRASASELSIPVAKMIQGRQNFIKSMISEMFNYQIQEGIRVGRIKPDVDTAFDIEMARVYLRDLSTIAGAVGKIGEALSVAVDQNWLTNDQAGELYRGALEQLGPIGDAVTPEAVSDNMDPRISKLADIMERNDLLKQNPNGAGSPSTARR